MRPVRLLIRVTAAATAASAGTVQRLTSVMANTRKTYDYTKRKDGFMGRENRRYWLIDLKTGKRKKITEEEYHEKKFSRESGH